MPLDLAVMLALAEACAPSVAPATLLPVAHVESGFDPLAIGVNGRRPSQIHPSSKAEAVETATRLIAHSADIDLGLGQINSRNLAPLGLSVADAFDPCRNLAASARMIQANYDHAGPQPGAEQAALRTSLSLYNTGDAQRGFRNGYVAKVTAAAARTVPALHADGAEAPAAPLSAPPAPAWDVFAQTRPLASGFVFTPPTSGDAIETPTRAAHPCHGLPGGGLRPRSC
jgi:type IV secretion system protein VirB1